ncbi:GIY-YIG nuclease family protein [Pelobacter propionicus]|uniref:Putative orphan protein n=1 Tax=Pelobacter propionicus (strain DSM 2379 / NBRC 103807 / OttBd1) TaxID=338966 RepID=A1ANM8_PELPD|nr:GIY-YIG nuclease family protein [Pelobacter propionicus]ABK98948.1 putative orphan protein [Pelobacter propionicus DSM 2379]
MLERKNIEFPLWRKKVDKSLFGYNGTTIPNWACDMWKLPETFADVSSKKDEGSIVKINFNSTLYDGWVTSAKKGRRSPAYRLWYDESLSLELKHTFLMSYMRSLETNLSSRKTTDIEKTIPFWEFLDIEYDSSKRLFKFCAYYTQEPSFPELFKRLVQSSAIQRIDDEIANKGEARIHKQDWMLRSALPLQQGAKNVIYTLIDTRNKLIYIGEAVDLVKRLSANYASIPHWDYFRYDVLPDVFAPHRVTLERMIIRDLAALLPNKKHDNNICISEYILANTKIDS